MKLKLINNYIIPANLILLLMCSCTSETAGRNMRHVLYTTKESEIILTGLSRTNRADEEDGYLLYASIQSKQKGLSKGYSGDSYVISVLPGDQDPRLYISLTSNTVYNFLGKDIGHAEPNGKFQEGGELAKLIYNYYITHVENILTEVYSPDLLQFNPLLRLDNWTALLSVRRIDSLTLQGNGDMILECELVSTNRMVNHLGEVQSWHIYKKLIHFIPSENNYTERIKEYPILFYEHDRRKPQVIKPLYPDWESFNNVYPHHKKILDYYLESTNGKNRE